MTYKHDPIFSETPYFDDFDDAKRFIKIMFKPGYAVQARELTQLQTLLQTQISKFGDHVFTNGSIVFGGSVSINKGTYLRVQGNYKDSLFRSIVGKTLLNSGGSVSARCVEVLEKTNTDTYPILLLQYFSGNTFNAGDIIFVENGSTKLSVVWESTVEVKALTAFTDSCLFASIDSGIFYIDGFFVTSSRQTIPLYTTNYLGVRDFSSKSASIGFEINRNIVTSRTDNTLNDPANGFYNYNAPGADRYVVDLILTSYPTTPTSSDYLELCRVVNSKMTYSKSIPSYSELIEIFARRTYDESGNYTVKPFNIELKEYVKKDSIVFWAQLKQESTSVVKTFTGVGVMSDADGEYVNTIYCRIQVGDILIDSNNYYYNVISANSVDLITNKYNTLEVEVVPFDNVTSSTFDPYVSLPKTGDKFKLQRIGKSSTEIDIIYVVSANSSVKIKSDVNGSVPLSQIPTTVNGYDLFTATINSGKAYVYGYEYETTSPINVYGKKPRTVVNVTNEVMDTSLGNYLIVSTGDSGEFNSDSYYGSSFDINNFPVVNIDKPFASFTIPVPQTEYSPFLVKYWTPSKRNTTNKYLEDIGNYNAYNWSETNPQQNPGQLSTAYYPHVIFLQQEDSSIDKVLRKELTTNVDDVPGFIEKRDINFADQNYWALLPNRTDENKPQSLPLSESINILDSSYNTEYSISRLVFNQGWSGDFITAYDSSFTNYSPGSLINGLFTREYDDNQDNYVYQVDFLNIGNIVTTSEGNITTDSLRQNVRVKRALTRRWIPGSSNETLSYADNVLFVRIPSGNVVFGSSLGETRGFSLPNSLNDNSEYSSVFNPRLGFETYYGSSIQVVSAEPNVVKLTLESQESPTVSCAQLTVGLVSSSITNRNHGSFKENQEVIQTYIKDGATHVATGIVKKVVVNGSVHEVFVKITGNEAPADFIPQGFEGLVSTTPGDYEYEAISALLQGNDIIDNINGTICACYTIKNVSYFSEGSPTCGIFTEITFTEGYQTGKDFTEGEQVYQFDLDFIPLDNANPPTNFDAERVLALGTVMNWNSETCTLSILATKNNFKSQNGWIFGRQSKVRYGGRGWNLNQSRQVTETYGTEQVKEIERVKGIFVDLDPHNNINFIDSFNSTEDPSILRRAYQVKTFEQQNQTEVTEERVATQQYANDEGNIFLAKGKIVNYILPSPVTGPGFLQIEAFQGQEESFFFRNKIANPLVVENGTRTLGNLVDVNISILTADVLAPNTEFYQDPVVQKYSSLSPTSSSFTTVATAKVKQIIQQSPSIFHLFLTDLKANVDPVGSVYYNLQNLSRVSIDVAGVSKSLFSIGDNFSVDSASVSSRVVQNPKNNSLLYEFPAGQKIKSISNLTYELQIDLKYSFVSGNTLVFTKNTTGNVEFKGAQAGTGIIDPSTLKEYYIIDNTSKVILLTDSKILSVKTVNSGSQLQVIYKAAIASAGTYTLIAPMIVEGTLGSNIRTKTKTRFFEVCTFGITNILRLSKSDVISIDSCIAISNSPSPIAIPSNVLVLNGNQKNSVYELSTIGVTAEWRDLNIKNPAGTTLLPTGIRCLVSYTYYDHGTGSGPIIPSSYINGYDSIPEYIDPLTNSKISLDSVIDFRPFQRKTSTGTVETSGIFGIPISGSSMQATYDYFLPNKYTMVLTRDKQFNILSGTPSLYSQYPDQAPSSMSLFNFEMPGYVKNANTVKTIGVNHQRYTMDDVRKLEDRVDNLEYTTRLSMLEQEAKSIKILDAMNQELPKTSILVDSFITHEVGDTLNKDYNICIDSYENTLRPPFEAKFLSLNNSTSSNITLSKVSQPSANIGQSHAPNLAYLNYTMQTIIDQRFVNNTFDVNPFSSSLWIGNITVTPNTIITYDTSIAPYIISNSNGNNDTFENMHYSGLNYNLGGFGTKWNFWQTNWQGSYQNPKTIESYFGRLTDYIKSQVPKMPKRTFGSKTLNMDVITFIPRTSISLRVRGLKPTTLVYALFDGIRVDPYIIPTSLTTSATGSLDITFSLPEKTFKSGEKYFVISDDENGDKSLSSTYAEVKILNSSITPDSSDYITVFGSKTSETKSIDSVDYRSALAQTFFVDGGQYPNGVFIKRVDIFFKSKDNTYPITLEIRPLKDGIPVVGPSSFAYPNASITKDPVSINVTDAVTTTTLGTAFEFDAPVYLLPGEHAITLITNSNKYVVHSSDHGENSTISGSRISPVPYVGKMMTTNTSKNWTVYENTDIAFIVNRCLFTTDPGVITFKDFNVGGSLQYSYAYANINLSYSDFNANQISANIMTTNLNESGVEVLESTDINFNSNISFNKLKMFKTNGNSFILEVNMNSNDGVISPIIDLDSLKLIAVKNLVKTSSTSPVGSSIGVTRLNNELRTTSLVHPEYANARYITKIVSLDPEMLTKNCNVYCKINKPAGTDIRVYIKRQYINTEINIDEIQYEEMIAMSLVPDSIGEEFIDVLYSISQANNVMIRYNIKIVMFSNIDYSHVVPKLKDLKIITTP